MWVGTQFQGWGGVVGLSPPLYRTGHEAQAEQDKESNTVVQMLAFLPWRCPEAGNQSLKLPLSGRNHVHTSPASELNKGVRGPFPLNQCVWKIVWPFFVETWCFLGQQWIPPTHFGHVIQGYAWKAKLGIQRHHQFPILSLKCNQMDS